MPVVEKSVVINAPVDKVFGINEDPKRVTEYMPGIVRVADIVKTRKRIGDSQRLTYSVLGVRFPSKVTIQGWEKDKRMVAKLQGALTGTFTATYEPQGGATKVTWRIDYTMKADILERAANHPLASRMNESNLARGLEDLKLLCEGT